MNVRFTIYIFASHTTESVSKEKRLEKISSRNRKRARCWFSSNKLQKDNSYREYVPMPLVDTKE